MLTRDQIIRDRLDAIARTRRDLDEEERRLRLVLDASPGDDGGIIPTEPPPPPPTKPPATLPVEQQPRQPMPQAPSAPKMSR